MATRPIYFADDAAGEPVYAYDMEFDWVAGMAISQKQKCIQSLHSAIGQQWKDSAILEVSSKSENPLGVKLSAFNLGFERNGKFITVECAFQGSKVFEHGGPFLELYEDRSIRAKQFFQDKDLGRLIKFSFFGKEDWELDPPTMFYDWIYINSLHRHSELIDEVIKYDVFTDIEFNPKRSINCQARSVALYVGLHQAGILGDVIEDKSRYKEYICSVAARHKML